MHYESGALDAAGWEDWMKDSVLEISAHFRYAGEAISYEPCHVGHINDTYFVTCKNGDGVIRYVLQKLNTNVFTKPVEVMSNMVGVCEFLKKKIAAEGGDVDRETLTVVPSLDGKMYYVDPDGGFWRTYIAVENVVTYNLSETPDMFRSAGCSFGRFFNRLADYPAEQLYITIPNFHNTVSRFADLRTAIAEDKAGRAKDCRAEIEFALAHEGICSYLMDGIADGRFKLGVTHNDTKLNNILIDKTTNRGICIIDLDTVMPGSLLFDFGDAIRFGASSALEDETDLDRVFVVPEMFAAYVDGFMSELRSTISAEEIRAFPMAARVITFEIGTRFLTDYLNGDIYYATHRPNQNLDRARVQFAMVRSMEAQASDMEAIVRCYR